MSKKQYLARTRNYFKYVLTGIPKPIDKKSLTLEELSKWNHILDLRRELLDDFDDNSRLRGLKVPFYKCWCGKEGKYDSNTNYYNGLVCKKHIER